MLFFLFSLCAPIYYLAVRISDWNLYVLRYEYEFLQIQSVFSLGFVLCVLFKVVRFIVKLVLKKTGDASIS